MKFTAQELTEWEDHQDAGTSGWIPARSEGWKILPKINKQLDKVCGDYMMDREKCKRAAFTEIKCQLLQAIIKTEDNDQLQVEIKKIIEAI